MVKISIFYPNTPGARFDMDYYIQEHMPVSIEKLSASKGFRGVSVERGIEGEQPGSPPTYIAMCHFLFDSAEDFIAAFLQHAEFLQGDMPNYTDMQAVIQFSAVEIAR
ncbi:MAG TPA: EthD family reductase [Ktedonobacterales bacterium]|nr:EthD family reductase [Ktedonobacterales bacterium]